MSEPTTINENLAIATIITRMEFTTELATGHCSLVIELVDNDKSPSVRVLVEAGGVSEWNVQTLGGGISQLACLRAKDVSGFQHDRVRFVLEDIENGAMSLKCEKLSTSLVPVYARARMD